MATPKTLAPEHWDMRSNVWVEKRPCPREARKLSSVNHAKHPSATPSTQAPLLGQANPGVTPNPSKAPWYFLGLQELLSRFPPLMAGVAFPTFVIVLMILVPFLDRNPSRRPSERKVAIILFGLYMVIVVALVIIGTFFRGHEFIWNWGWVLGSPQTCGGTAC